MVRGKGGTSLTPNYISLPDRNVSSSLGEIKGVADPSEKKSGKGLGTKGGIGIGILKQKGRAECALSNRGLLIPALDPSSIEYEVASVRSLGDIGAFFGTANGNEIRSQKSRSRL